MGIILGVDIGGTDIKLGIVEGQKIELAGKIPTRPSEGPKIAAQRIVSWCKEHRMDKSIVASGIACAGLVDREAGVVRVSPNLTGWIDVPLRSIFEEILETKIVIENDANAAAYGEWQAGAGRGLENFVCLTLGTGIGGGLVLNGKLYRGSTGFAGEIGHMVIMEGGPVCSCGRRGCFEALVGSAAIISRASRMLEGSNRKMDDFGTQPTVEKLALAAVRGDGLIREVFKETGYYLGVALANIVLLLAPQAIAIGGGVAGARELILAPAREALKRNVMHESMMNVRIVPAELASNAAVIGAALIASHEG